MCRHGKKRCVGIKTALKKSQKYPAKFAEAVSSMFVSLEVAQVM